MEDPLVSRMFKLPEALPCGCRIKNRQGKTISGPHAPTSLTPSGMRRCRCGRYWEAFVTFNEVRR